MKKDSNIDTEFVDINKENKYKDYIIVGILYVVVIILSIFLILGIKNQKDIVENNLKEENVTNKSEDNLENSEISNEDNAEKEEINSNKNSLFDGITEVTEETSEQIEENNDTYTNIFNQLD